MSPANGTDEREPGEPADRGGAAARSQILHSPRWRLPTSVRSSSRPVIAVSAPAGYGKSTLLREWKAEVLALGYRVVWLVVDGDDRDGDKLAVDLLNAFALTDAQRSRSFLGGTGLRGKRAVILALLAELAANGHRTVVFIDDIHFLEEATAQAIVKLLVAHQPDELALVFSGRTLFGSDIGQALLEGRLERLTAETLAFTEAEVGDLLRQYAVEARPELVLAIWERTEGWPALIRLVAMTLQADPGAQERFVQGLLDRRMPIAEYLSDVLLAHLPAATAHFLTAVSLLRNFDAELATLTTGVADAGALLDDLERRALPFRRSDDPDLPFALHPVVREFLLVRLKRERSDVLDEYARRARAWLTARGRIDAAIDVCLDAGDVDAAAELIDRFARSGARHYGRHATFLYWCNKIPASHLTRYPKIQLIRTWSLNIMRRYAEADAIWSDLERDLPEFSAPAVEGDEHDPGRIRQAIELERIVQLALRDHWMALRLRARKWLERWSSPDPMEFAIAHNGIACGEMAVGNLSYALEELRIAQAAYHGCGAPYIGAWGDMWVATVLAKQGHYRQALYECDQAIGRVKTLLGGQTPTETMLHAIRALLLYELDRLDEASVALENGLTAVVEQCSVDTVIMGHVALARLQNQQGSPLGALETLAEGEAVGRSHNLPRLTIALAAERVVLLLRSGAALQAKLIWTELQDSVSEEWAQPFDRALVDKAGRIEARMAISRGDFDSARELAAAPLERAIATGQKRKTVECLLIRSIAWYGARKQQQAIESFRLAVNIAMAEGYVRLFADEGEALRPILAAFMESHAAKEGPSRDYLMRLSTAFEQSEGKATEDFTNATQAPLTHQEIRILHKMQAGLSNRQLAASLFVSEGTVKWHLKNIFWKLGATNRLTAVAAARRQGVLSD